MAHPIADFASSLHGGPSGSTRDDISARDEGQSHPTLAPPPIAHTHETGVSSDDILLQQSFREVLQFIADRSDVDLKTPIHLLADRRVHLLSEQFQPKDSFVSITTTEAVQKFVRAFEDEFQRRDITPTSLRAIKLFTIFKPAMNRPKKAELTDQDLSHFEKQTKISVRVANFLESLLQAWKHEPIPIFMIEKIGDAIVHATKTILQTLTPMLGQFVQLRRDLYLLGSSAPLDVQQKLRHAPTLGEKELFPPDMLLELDERVKRSCENSIIIQTIRKTQNAKSENYQKRPWAPNGNSRSWGRSEKVNSDPPSSPEIQQFQSPEVSPQKAEKAVPERKCHKGIPQTEMIALQKTADAQKAIPVGGRLQQFWKAWKAKGTPKRIYNWFRKGYYLSFAAMQRQEADKLLKSECPTGLLSKYGLHTEKQAALDKLVQSLL